MDGVSLLLLLLLMVIGGNCRKEAQGTSEARPPNFNSPLDGCFITQRPRLILCGTLVREWAYD